jgi:hypothetical protein
VEVDSHAWLKCRGISKQLFGVAMHLEEEWLNLTAITRKRKVIKQELHSRQTNQGD